MEYRKLLKDSWSYYKENPVLIIPYLLFAVFVEFITSLTSQALNQLKAGVIGGNVQLIFLSVLLIFLASVFVMGLIVELVRRMEKGKDVLIGKAFDSFKEKLTSFYGAMVMKLAVIFIPPVVAGLIYGMWAFAKFKSNLIIPAPASVFALVAGSIIYIFVLSLGLMFMEEEIIVFNNGVLSSLKNSLSFLRSKSFGLIVFVGFYIGIAILGFLMIAFITSLFSIMSTSLSNSVQLVLSILFVPYLLMLKIMFYIRSKEEM